MISAVPLRSLLAAASVAAVFAALIPQAQAQTTTADPFKDPRYMSGHRDIAPAAIPEELQNVDALTRVSAMKRIIACGDPYAFPYTEITDVARGFDVDLLKAIAEAEGWEAQFVWVNTANRGGLNRAFRTTIKKGVCDVFLGLGTGGLEEVLERSKLKLMAPTFGVHYVFATFKDELRSKSLEDLKGAKIRAGATYFTPTENILARYDIEHETFPQARRAIAAMHEGTVDVVLIPSTSMADAKRDFPDRKLHVIESIEPKDALQWNNTWATQGKEKELRAFLEKRIARMTADGKVQEILGRYGIPYFPPISN